MWENDRKKKAVKNVVLILLIFILLGVLAYTFLYLKARSEEHDAQLAAIQVQQQQQLTADKEESLAVIQSEYEKDLRCVEDYVPGIVCWGDSITLGSSGSTSYPSILQKYINTYICEIYDFRSTIENAQDYARLKWDDYRIGIPVVNMGAGPETSGTVLGRCGAAPYLTASPIVLPADTTPVEIALKTPDGKEVNPLTGGDAGINNLVISGVEGVLSADSAATSWFTGGKVYYFTRLTPGEETPVEAGTVVYTAGTDMYKDYIHIVCIGTYGGFDTPEELVAQTKQLLARQAKNSDRYIVLGMPGYSAGYTRMDLEAVETAMLQAFGNKYVSTRSYLRSDALVDAKISKTQDDIQALEYNLVPPCFLTSSTGVELNGTATTLIGKLVFNRMEDLGYFEEIYQELGISDTINSILKDNPDYFQNVLKYLIK